MFAEQGKPVIRGKRDLDSRTVAGSDGYLAEMREYLNASGDWLPLSVLALVKVV
jgi:hypothetical protein